MDQNRSGSTSRRLAAQQAATRALIEAAGVDDAFRRVLRDVSEALGWELAIAWAPAEGEEVLLPAAAWSRGPSGPFRQATEALRFRKGEGLPGRVWQSGEPSWVTDLDGDDNFPRGPAAAEAGLSSALAFPVALESHVLAVLEFFTRERVAPDRGLLESMAAIGQQMGLYVRRNEAEARLREQEERYRLVTETSPDVIVVIDSGDRIRSVNAAVARVFGWSPEELVGRPLSLLMPADMRERHRQGLRRVTETGERRVDWSRVQMPGLRRDGTIVQLEISFGTFLSDGQRLFTGIMRDISERLEQQRRLEQSTAELEGLVDELEAQRAAAEAARQEAEHARRAALEAARRASFMAEAGRALGTSLARHDTLKTLANLAVPAIADICIVDFLDEDGAVRRVEAAGDGDRGAERARTFRERFRPPSSSLYAAGTVMHTGEPRLLSEVGEDGLPSLASEPEQQAWLRAQRVSSLMAVPLLARGHSLGAVTFLAAESGRRFELADLTLAEALADRAALAIENATLYEQALNANRAKGNFLAIMSHELRTPLTAIMGYTDILEAGIAGKLADQQLKYLHRVMVSARHLLQLIDEILTFSRLEVGRERPQARRVELRDFARRTVALVMPAVREKELDLELVLPEQDVYVETDPEKLRQVLLDVLLNAVKFTRHGRIRFSASRENEELHFEVADTGIGIRREDLERIFDPFWQAEEATTRREGGTGIGLSVAWRLVHVLGGQISVQSTPGQGSIFTIRVPAVLRAPGAADSAAA